MKKNIYGEFVVTQSMIDCVGHKVRDIINSNPNYIKLIILQDIVEMYVKGYSVLQIVQQIKKDYGSKSSKSIRTKRS